MCNAKLKLRHIIHISYSNKDKKKINVPYSQQSLSDGWVHFRNSLQKSSHNVHWKHDAYAKYESNWPVTVLLGRCLFMEVIKNDVTKKRQQSQGKLAEATNDSNYCLNKYNP